MNAKQAVAQRIMELCKSRNITINTLANDAGGSTDDNLQYAQREEQESGHRDDQAGMRRS